MADRYWVGGTGNWSDTNRWSTGSGGGGGASVPTTADNVFFDNASAAGTFTVTITAGSACANFDASGITDAAKKMSLGGASTGSLSVAGSWINPTSTFYASTFSSTPITFSSTATGNTIRTNGVTFASAGNPSVTFNGIGGGWTLLDAFTVGGAFGITTLTNGALDLNGFTFTTPYFNSNNSNIRSIAFGTTGSVVVGSIGVGATWVLGTITNFSYTGNSSVTVTLGAAQHGSTAGGTEANAINLTITGSSTGFTAGSHFRNYTTSPTFSGTAALAANFYGDITIGALTNLGSTVTAATIRGSGTQNITMNGRSADQPITFSGTGTYNLVDGLTTGATRAITLTSGTLNLNGQTLTGGTFVNTGAATRAITFNGGAISLAGSGATTWNASGSGFTSSAGTNPGTISMTSASAKTFVGGGYNYAATLNQGGAGTLTISGNNTFQSISNTYNLVAATTITFTAASTQTVTRFEAYGSGNKALTLNSSTPGTKFNLVATRGTIDVSYCRISDSSVSGGARWQAYNTQGNVNVSGNVGWNFIRRSARTFMKMRVKSI
jgi:hypothetical protein